MDSSQDNDESNLPESSQLDNNGTHFPWEVPKNVLGSTDVVHTPSQPSHRKSSRKTSKPNRYHDAFLSLYAHTVPFSYKTAKLSEEYGFWKPGIDQEHDCLIRNRTWTFVKKVPGIHILPCKYIFRVKNSAPKVQSNVCSSRKIHNCSTASSLSRSIRFGM